jgi:hypothetical protein
MEIGESLVYSWLKHVKKCSIIQSNWKPAKNWSRRKIEDKELFISEIEAILKRGNIDINLEDKIIKNSSQTEVDVIGLNFDDKKLCFAIESAFHEQGLHYKGKDFKSAIIIKLIRAAFAIHEYLDVDTVDIVFVSPVIIKKNRVDDLDELKVVLDELSKLFTSKFSAKIYTFDVYFEEVYQSKLISTILSEIDNISDQSESFVRALKLVRLFKENLPKVSDEEDDKPAIGAYASDSIRRILKNANQDKRQELIQVLSSKEESRKVFGISFQVLINEKDINYEKLKTRYYKKSENVGEEKYFICSQWYERHLRS